MSAQFCPTCRSRQFIPAAPTLNLGCLSRILVWTVVIFALKWGFANIGMIFGALWSFLAWLIGCTLMGWFWGVVKFGIAVKFVIWAVSLGSKDLAKQIDPFPKVVPALLRAVGAFLLYSLKGLLFLVEGKRLSLEPRKKPRGEGDD